MVSEIGRYKIFTEYGYSSTQYQYFYYYSDAILTICLYFALSTLYSHVFSEMKAERYVKIGALLLLGGTAAFTAATRSQANARINAATVAIHLRLIPKYIPRTIAVGHPPAFSALHSFIIEMFAAKA